jgi:hypothetical protein
MIHKCFVGYDERQPVSFNVLQQSIIAQASEPVAITPLRISQLPMKRTGLTPFTFSRFLVPYLCNYEGTALFLDVDIVLNGDICELMRFCDIECAVQVSKNEHRFEWASAMLFNCGHEANKILTPEYIETAERLHTIEWCKEELVGDLPREWNHLVGYDTPRADAKLIHYTQGVPAYPETIECEYGELWHKWQRMTNYTKPWAELMGPSIHAVHVNGKPLPKFLFDLEKEKPKPEHLETVKKLMTA